MEKKLLDEDYSITEQDTSLRNDFMNTINSHHHVPLFNSSTLNVKTIRSFRKRPQIPNIQKKPMMILSIPKIKKSQRNLISAKKRVLKKRKKNKGFLILSDVFRKNKEKKNGLLLSSIRDFVCKRVRILAFLSFVRDVISSSKKEKITFAFYGIYNFSFCDQRESENKGSYEYEMLHQSNLENMRYLLSTILAIAKNKKEKYNRLFYFTLRKNLRQQRKTNRGRKPKISFSGIKRIGFSILEKKLLNRKKDAFLKISRVKGKRKRTTSSCIVYGRVKDLWSSRSPSRPSKNKSQRIIFKNTRNIKSQSYIYKKDSPEKRILTKSKNFQKSELLRNLNKSSKREKFCGKFVMKSFDNQRDFKKTVSKLFDKSCEKISNNFKKSVVINIRRTSKSDLKNFSCRKVDRSIKSKRNRSGLRKSKYREIMRSKSKTK